MERLPAVPPGRVVGLVQGRTKESVCDCVDVAKATSPGRTRTPRMPARVTAAKIQVAVTLSGSVVGLFTEREDRVTKSRWTFWSRPTARRDS